MPYHIFNLGGKNPIPLLSFLYTLEEIIGKKSVIEWLPMQQGDVGSTYADIAASEKALGFNL